jgi:hypothetical protein
MIKSASNCLTNCENFSECTTEFHFRIFYQHIATYFNDILARGFELLFNGFSESRKMTCLGFAYKQIPILGTPIAYPSGNGPFPAVIGIGFSPTGSLPSDIFSSRGIATIQFPESQISNGWSNVRGDGPFFELYPDTSKWNGGGVRPCRLQGRP